MNGLLRYLARRLVFALLLILLVSSGALWLTRMAPGDFAADLVLSGADRETIARERARLGLDRPVLEQNLEWLGRAVRLDLGTSVAFGRPVRELVLQRAANTAVLAAAALGLATAVGMPLGVLAASHRGAVPAAIRAMSVLALSLPPLLTSLLFAFFAARTGWFPIGGMTSLDVEGLPWLHRVGDYIWHLALPSLALALPMAATLERLQSQAMRETLAQPYILLAAARGVPQSRLLWRSALRVAVKPVLAIYGIVIGSLLSGSFAVEIVTAWPGMGRLTYEALLARDVYLVAGCASIGALFLAAGTLLSDLALAAADPRLRET